MSLEFLLEQLFRTDESLREIIFSGPATARVYSARGQKIERKAWFPDRIAMMRQVQTFARNQGLRLDPNHPSEGGHYRSGELWLRWHGILPPLAIDGPIFTARKLQASHIQDAESSFWGDSGPWRQFSPQDIKSALAQFPTIIFGPTGSGKTTLLLKILHSLQDEHVLILDTNKEIVKLSSHWLILSPSSPDGDGRGGYPFAKLEQDALRLRPDRMVIAEIRDGEAPAFLSTCANGHNAPLATIHASSPAGALSRIANLAHRHGCTMSQSSEFCAGKFNFVGMKREPSPHAAMVCLGNTPGEHRTATLS